MYIEPNTTLKVIKNCPLDKSYTDTIFFNSVAEQTQFFITTLPGYTFQNNTYQRVNNGKIRIARNAESLYHCNYLAFQNASFGNKWFYAFINKIEYVNNITSEITYEIDVMQTWHFNYTLMQCLVEREHSALDILGNNLVPENLETGEYICEPYEVHPSLTPLKIVFWCTFDEQYDTGGGWGYNQGHGYYYSGLIPTSFPLTPTGIDEAIDWLHEIHANKINGLVSCCVVPSIVDVADVITNNNMNITKPQTLYRSDGNPVKNQKCLTYPYNFLYVTNNNGKSAEYRYEFFNTPNYPSRCMLHAFADYSTNPTAILYPLYYKGNDQNYDEKITLTGYPQIALNIDSFKAWLAQNASSAAINAMMFDIGNSGYATANLQSHIAAQTAGAVVGPMAGMEMAFGGVALGAALQLAKTAVSGAIHATMPPQSKGHQGSSVLQAMGILNFGIIKKHITPEFVTIIDDYFNMYGYALHKVKFPNRCVRPHWTYTKTIACKIEAGYPTDALSPDPGVTDGLPADDAAKIESIYDNGIRFWLNPAEIGIYTYDNSPVVEGGE